MSFKITYKLDGAAAASKKDLQDAQRDTWRFVGKYWHRFFKSIKFTTKGAKKYGFVARAGNPGSGVPFRGSYSQRKVNRRANGKGIRSLGENKPNVWSGQSRASAMDAQKVKATARSSGQGKVEIIIDAPTLNFKNPKAKAHPRKEIETVANDELREMQRVGANRFNRNLGRIQRRKLKKTQ